MDGIKKLLCWLDGNIDVVVWFEMYLEESVEN